MPDPFATEPDEAQQPETTNDVPPATPSEAPVSSDDNFPVKITLKGGSGYDAPWLTHEFRSVDEADEILNGPDGVKLAEVLAKVQAVAKFFVAKNEIPKTGSQARSAGSASAGATDAPAWMGSAPSCPHGPKKYVTKVSAKTGKPWHAWGCNGTKDDQCAEGLEFKNPPK